MKKQHIEPGTLMIRTSKAMLTFSRLFLQIEERRDVVEPNIWRVNNLSQMTCKISDGQIAFVVSVMPGMFDARCNFVITPDGIGWYDHYDVAGDGYWTIVEGE